MGDHPVTPNPIPSRALPKSAKALAPNRSASGPVIKMPNHQRAERDGAEAAELLFGLTRALRALGRNVGWM